MIVFFSLFKEYAIVHFGVLIIHVIVEQIGSMMDYDAVCKLKRCLFIEKRNKIFSIYSLDPRETINGTCPGTYACDRNTPLVCFQGLCLWFEKISFLIIYYSFILSLVQPQRHGMVRIAHVPPVKPGREVLVLSADRDKNNWIY